MLKVLAFHVPNYNTLYIGGGVSFNTFFFFFFTDFEQLLSKYN